MKNKLEPLLNSLIERGWKPYGIDKDDIEVCEYSKDSKKISIGYMNWVSPSKGDYDWLFISLRELVGKESGLWQFCVENNLVKLIENPNKDKLPRDRMSEEEYRMWEYNVYYSFSNKKDIHKRYEQGSLTYRLIESALCDEDKLEEFLLNSIKLD